jgi:hypothetical protein
MTAQRGQALNPVCKQATNVTSYDGGRQVNSVSDSLGRVHFDQSPKWYMVTPSGKNGVISAGKKAYQPATVTVCGYKGGQLAQCFGPGLGGIVPSTAWMTQTLYSVMD